MARPLLVLLAVLTLTAGTDVRASVQLPDFVPIGVRYTPARDPARLKRDLEEIRRLHFNVVEVPSGEAGRTLNFVDRLIAGAPYAGLPDPDAYRPAVIATTGGGADVTLRSWTALARGARAFVFDDWSRLSRRAEALAAAAAFAEAVTRNAALYSRLRPGGSGNGRLRTDAPAGLFEARLLHSADALLLVALHHGRSSRDVTIAFPSQVPGAIWRNMQTGASVNFVAGPDGPTYTRTYAPREVVVLLINTLVR
jgi:hypothetical protein